MCGLVGFFNGCELDVACPKKIAGLCSGDTGDQPQFDPFRNWDQKASVRVTPRRTDNFGDLLFPISLVPLLRSKKLIGLASHQVDDLRRSALFRFMNFTHKLEILVVNTVTANIALQKYNFLLPDLMRVNAHKIYVDEAYHALVAFETMQAIKAKGAADLMVERAPNFLDQLRREIALEPSGQRKALIELFFVIASEMLITDTLGNVNRHGAMDNAVRSIIRDHAADEARHHAFYRLLLVEIWGQLAEADQLFVSEKLPQLVLAYCIPEVDGLSADLVHLGLGAPEIAEILDEIYPPGTTRAYAMQVGSALFKLVTELSAPNPAARLMESLEAVTDI